MTEKAGSDPIPQPPLGDGPLGEDEIELLSRALTARLFDLLSELPAKDREEFLRRKIFRTLPGRTSH